MDLYNRHGHTRASAGAVAQLGAEQDIELIALGRAQTADPGGRALSWTLPRRVPSRPSATASTSGCAESASRSRPHQQRGDISPVGMIDRVDAGSSS